MLAERHRGAVENDEIVVGVKVLPEPDVVAVIAPERCKDRKTPAGRAEQTAHQLALPCLIGRWRPVVGKAQLLRREPFLRKLFAACIVEQTAQHFSFSVMLPLIPCLITY